MAESLAIIGMGASGTLMFNRIIESIQIQNKNADDINLILINETANIAKANIYGPMRSCYLMNSIPDVYLLRREGKETFFDWLINKKKIKNPCSYKDFPSRNVFGAFLLEMYTEAYNRAKELQLNVDVIIEQVENISCIREQYKLEFGSKRQMNVDNIILCLGNLCSEVYINEKYRSSYFTFPSLDYNFISGINKSKSVGIIGTRLSAIDAICALTEQQHNGKIVMASRSGNLPRVKAKTCKIHLNYMTINNIKKLKSRNLNEIIQLLWMDIKKLIPTIAISFDEYISSRCRSNAKNSLSKDIYLAENYMSIWQSVLIEVAKIIPDIWGLLNNDEKMIFIDKFFGEWQAHIGSFPIESAKKVLSLLRRKQLSVLPGLTAVSYCHTSNQYILSCENDAPVYLDYLINASGFNFDLLKSDNKLINNLMKNKVVKEHFISGIEVDTETLRVINDNSRHNSVYAIGDLTRGTFLTTSNIDYINSQCEKVARTLLSTLSQYL